MTDQTRDSNSIRDRLLAQVAVPGTESTYRKEVAVMLEKQERRLRVEQTGASALWIFAVLMGTLFLLVGGYRRDGSAVITMELLGLFLLIAAAVELLKYFISRSRVELLRAIKSLEVEVLELKSQIGRSSGKSDA